MTWLRRSPTYALLVVACLVTLAPLAVVTLTSFFPPGTPISGVRLPTSLSWSTFTEAWVSGGFSTAFLVSGGIALMVVALVTALSICAGYALGVLRFRGSRIVLYAFMAGIVLPYVALVVPLYFQLQALHLLGSVWAVVIAETGLYLGFGVFWMHAFFVSVPPSLIEAARMDGASPLQVLRLILLPISRPVVMTLMLLTFLSSWNEYLVPLVVGTGGRADTVSLGLASFQGQHLTDIPSLAAASILVAGPALLVYLATQRTFVRGLLDGAVK